MSIMHNGFALDLNADEWERLFHHVLSMNEYGHLENGVATYVNEDSCIIVYSHDEESNLYKLVDFMRSMIAS